MLFANYRPKAKMMISLVEINGKNRCATFLQLSVHKDNARLNFSQFFFTAHEKSKNSNRANYKTLQLFLKLMQAGRYSPA